MLLGKLQSKLRRVLLLHLVLCLCWAVLHSSQEGLACAAVALLPVLRPVLHLAGTAAVPDGTAGSRNEHQVKKTEGG